MYLRHLNALEHREYGVALNTLHQYFDYALWHGPLPSHVGTDLPPGQGTTNVSHNESKTNDTPSTNTNTSVNNINNGFPTARPAVQYASLCLGALHYVFGHLEQARLSIDESMRVAQQYGDHRCVTFSSAWIQRMESDVGTISSDASTRRLLERAASRANALGIPHLQALTSFTMVEENMRGVNLNGNTSSTRESSDPGLFGTFQKLKKMKK